MAENDYLDLTEDIETIYEQYEAIRKSGETNMLNTPVVLQIAEGLGFDELADQIANGDYLEILKNYDEAVERGYISP